MDIFITGFRFAAYPFAGSLWLSGFVEFVIIFRSIRHPHRFDIDISLEGHTRITKVLHFVSNIGGSGMVRLHKDRSTVVLSEVVEKSLVQCVYARGAIVAPYRDIGHDCGIVCAEETTG
jgi:hypothetical protein